MNYWGIKWTLKKTSRYLFVYVYFTLDYITVDEQRM